MPNMLLELEVNRVDLVDEGSNSEAFIKLYKRKENSDDMNLDEILEKMKPEHAALVKEAVTKAAGEIPTAAVEELAKAKADLEVATEEVTKSKTAIETLTVEVAKAKEDLVVATTSLEDIAKAKAEADKNLSEEEVIKSLDPTVQEVFKSMKAQKVAAEEVVKGLQEQKLNDEAIAKAKELKNLPAEEATLVAIAKSASNEVFEILKAANKALENAGIFQEIGKNKGGDAGSSAWEKIEKKAEALVESEKITIQKAIANVIKEYPELYKEYLSGGMN
jgi:hypothetical protein